MKTFSIILLAAVILATAVGVLTSTEGQTAAIIAACGLVSLAPPCILYCAADIREMLRGNAQRVG
jgi:flavin reductase (DIM6/NTAB) family NADH-FMN oxidoreductase RutF